jgi:predicted transcriptional regulator YdeE
MERIKSFQIIGISTVTTNANGKSVKDLEELWATFYREKVSEKIPNKESEDVYSIYTDYESDYKGKYTSIIGHRVSSIVSIPEGMVVREFNGGNYLKFTAKGEMPKAVIEIWQEIWNQDNTLNRQYTTDFEIYSEKSQRGAESEVEIYIATD